MTETQGGELWLIGAAGPPSVSPLPHPIVRLWKAISSASPPSFPPLLLVQACHSDPWAEKVRQSREGGGGVRSAAVTALPAQSAWLQGASVRKHSYASQDFFLFFTSVWCDCGSSLNAWVTVRSTFFYEGKNNFCVCVCVCERTFRCGLGQASGTEALMCATV